MKIYFILLFTFIWQQIYSKTKEVTIPIYTKQQFRQISSVNATRRSNWIPIIEKQIEKESTFIAVGAAHLAGEKGVLNLLKEKRYSVSAVK